MSGFGASPSGASDRAMVAALGESESSLEALRRAPLTDHYLWVFLVRYAPVFEPVRDRPGHRELVREMNRAPGPNPDGSLPAGPSLTPPLSVPAPEAHQALFSGSTSGSRFSGSSRTARASRPATTAVKASLSP